MSCAKVCGCDVHCRYESACIVGCNAEPYVVSAPRLRMGVGDSQLCHPVLDGATKGPLYKTQLLLHNQLPAECYRCVPVDRSVERFWHTFDPHVVTFVMTSPNSQRVPVQLRGEHKWYDLLVCPHRVVQLPRGPCADAWSDCMFHLGAHIE